MRQVNESLKEIINKDTINLARCWKITLKNADILAFTNNDENFTYENIEYNSISANDVENILSNCDIKNDTFHISNVISSDLISANDILSGKYDNAKIKIFIIDVMNLAKGEISLMNGTIFGIEYKDNLFIARVKGLKDEVAKNLCEIYSPLCRANFCDRKCKININDFTFNGLISEIINNNTFLSKNENILNKNNGYFENGTIEFTSGDNKYFKTEIRQFSNGIFMLSSELPHKLKINDEFKVIAGCNKKFETCCEKFKNALNFRGEPHLPGIELLLKVL